MQATIEVTGLRKRFGRTLALDGMSFRVEPGQVTGFVGPNGAGKSTTMRVILGLDAVDEGTALVDGKPYRDLRHPLSRIGSLLDASAVQPSRSARNHLLWLAHSQGLGGERVDAVIDQAGLTSAARRRAGGFSLGMRQRLGIAAALLGDPPVLMMDEPFNGMDPEGIVWMRGFLRSLAAEGRAVLVSSHLMSELQDTADHLVVVGRGRVIADTSVRELLAAASGDRVTLRTAARSEAMTVLAHAGATVTATDRDTITVAGMPPQRIVALLGEGSVPFAEVSAHRASLEEAYMELTRDAVEFRATPTEDSMTAIAPYRSEQAPGADGFAQLLHAEWTKFRTVRGWLVAVVLAPLLLVLFALLTANGSHAGTCINGKCTTAKPFVLTGPDGEAVTDSFYFVHQPLGGDGSITARLTSMTGLYSASGPVPAGPSASGLQSGLQSWTKVGLMVKASTTQGSSYAAIMLTGSHGVRMQYDFTHDIAGPPTAASAVSATSPRWLRLTRSGTTVTGFESVDGATWTKVGGAQLPALSGTLQAGLFAASPDHTVTQSHFGGGSTTGGPTRVTGVFDHLDFPGATGSAGWQGSYLASGPDRVQGGLGFHQAGGTVTLTGSGDIAPGVGGSAGNSGEGVERTLVGAFAALIVLIVLATLFITSEYRRGLIRTTFAASPHRGRVLAAKAVVLAAVTFVVGLIAAAVAMPVAEHILRANGNAIYPVGTFTKARVIVGTAALLAVAAVLTLAVGTLLRRSAGAVTLVIAVTVLPYIVATASVLPAVPTEWLLRLTPAAGFAIQQSVVRYPQVSADYSPVNGFYPLAPWAGFAVLCGYAAVALGLAVFALDRRDA